MNSEKFCFNMKPFLKKKGRGKTVDIKALHCSRQTTVIISAPYIIDADTHCLNKTDVK